MRQAIGTTQIINYIMIFIVITFGFLIATLSYMKAFKVNSQVALSIEKFEGNNPLAKADIKRKLDILGYRKEATHKCPNGYSNMLDYKLCVKRVPELGTENGYYKFKLITYINMDIPLLGGQFSIPVYSETEKMFKYGE